MASLKGPRKARERFDPQQWDAPGNKTRSLTGESLRPDRAVVPLKPKLDDAVAQTDGFAAGTGAMRRSQGRISLQQLDAFFDRSLITDVEGIIKIGKEASAYRCRASQDLGGGLVVAKVYRSRQYRFKNDAVYLEGRERGLRGQIKRAVTGKTSFGREVGTALWVGSEWMTMQMLHAAGADVPEPLAVEGDALLMSYVGDDEDAAPQLNRIRMDLDEAKVAFKTVMRNVELMLKNNLVHGDLSPHNILYWEQSITIIDFPQSVDARFNSHAQEFLRRDLGNVCEYFNRQGLDEDPLKLADDLWARFTLGTL